jgi:hypothetical protein
MRTSLLLLVFAVGCGGGGSSFEGFYMIDAWNDNPTSCADPGPSVLGDGLHSETAFYVKKDSFFGESFLNARACIDLAECEHDAAEDTVHLGRFTTFDSGNDDGWSSFFASGSEDFTDPTMCSGTIFRDTLAPDGEDGVLIRMEVTETPLFPKRNDMCTDEDAEAAGAGLPCGSVETVHGIKIGDL